MRQLTAQQLLSQVDHTSIEGKKKVITFPSQIATWPEWTDYCSFGSMVRSCTKQHNLRYKCRTHSWTCKHFSPTADQKAQQREEFQWSRHLLTTRQIERLLVNFCKYLYHTGCPAHNPTAENTAVLKAALTSYFQTQAMNATQSQTVPSDLLPWQLEHFSATLNLITFLWEFTRLK